MVAWSGVWTAAEAEAFLTETTVPMRLACRTPADRLWVVALWFDYRDGQFVCATGREALLVDYVEHDSAVAFDVSTNEPPYRGVRGNGTASVAADPEKAALRGLLERYLGGTDSSLASKLLRDEREEVVIRITPERVYSWDFTERMADATSTDRE